MIGALRALALAAVGLAAGKQNTGGLDGGGPEY